MIEDKKNHVYVSITPRSFIWAFLVALLFFVAFTLRDLILIILTSVLLAAAISPMARWFVERRIPRVVAVLIVYTGFLLGLAATFYFLLIPLFQEIFSFLRALPERFDVLETYLPTAENESAFQNIPLFTDLIGDFSLRQIVEQTQGFFAGLSQGFLNTLFAVFGGVLNFFIIVVLSFYLSVQENGVGKFLKMITPKKHTVYVLDLWRRAELKIGYWMQGQIILAVLVAVLVYLCLLLLGIPNALLLAVLAGVFEIIPVFGPILAAVPAVAIAMIEGGNFMGPGLTIGLVVTGVYIIIQQFESQLIYPLVIRKVIGLSPIIVILSLIAGFKLAGLLGVVLSVPIAAIVLEFLNDMQSKKESGKDEKNISTNKLARNNNERI